MDSNYDRDVDNPDNYRLTVFYFNKNDKRVIVPKRNRLLGWTLNFGQLNTYFLLGSIIAIVILTKIFLL